MEKQKAARYRPLSRPGIGLLACAACVVLAGCRLPRQAAACTSPLAIGLVITELDDGHALAAVLVGNKTIMAVAEPCWTLWGDKQSGCEIPCPYTLSTGSVSNDPTFHMFRALDQLPQDDSGWTCGDPVWPGPKIPSDTFSRLQYLDVKLVVYLFSADSASVQAREFKWKIDPALKEKPELLPFRL